jgi:hypothetical protein
LIRFGKAARSLCRNWDCPRRFRCHDLQHTLASRLVMSGVPLRVVQILMAHKRIETTLRYFAPSRHPSSQGRGAPNRDSTWHYDWHRANRHGSKSRYRHKYFEMFGAQERTRTSTTVRPLAPEASASASSATWAQVKKDEAIFILRREVGFVNEVRRGVRVLARLRTEQGDC